MIPTVVAQRGKEHVGIRATRNIRTRIWVYPITELLSNSILKTGQESEELLPTVTLKSPAPQLHTWAATSAWLGSSKSPVTVRLKIVVHLEPQL